MASIEPNQYNLKDKHLNIGYSTSGIQGQPSLSYNDGQQTLNFHGDQIRVTDTEIGKLVSVTIKLTVDVGSTSFSMLLPTISLSGMGSQQSFDTIGIKTVHHTPFALPSQGVRETYETHYLKGTAEAVAFLAAQPGTGAGA